MIFYLFPYVRRNEWCVGNFVVISSLNLEFRSVNPEFVAQSRGNPAG